MLSQHNVRRNLVITAGRDSARLADSSSVESGAGLWMALDQLAWSVKRVRSPRTAHTRDPSHLRALASEETPRHTARAPR